MSIMMMRRRRALSSDNDREIPDVPVQWRRMIAYLGNYKLRLSIALFATAISAGLSLVFPAVVQRVVDSVLEKGDLQLLDQITMILLFVFLVRSISSLIETYNLNYVGERVMVDLRKQLYAHLQQMSVGFFADRRVGELVSRIASDVTVMRTALTSNINRLLQQVLTMFGSMVIMFVLNWRLSMFIIAIIPVIVIAGFAFGYFLRKMSTKVQDEIAGATVVAEEVFQGIREVKSFAREDYEVQRYDGAIDRAFVAAIRLLRVRSVFGPFIGFMAFGGLSLILWFGGREVIAGRLSGGQLISFLIYGMTVAGSFSALISLYSSFQEAIGSTKRVFEILNTEPMIRDKTDAVILDNVDGRISFKDIMFSYDDRQQVLHDINLDIESGEVLALVGPSGAGKSTMFNLIPRFYDPTEGKVCIDGQNLRDVSQRTLREQIGIVPQEVLLFGGSILENIRYGRLDATDDEVIEAAKAANAHDFIDGFTDGYETVVGERGAKLSGGQRQRIAIARAILKDPRILLLDEATSSLDSESEQLVQEALARLMQGRTTIIIAHRLSTIRIADRIAVLENGSISELGTHDDLMAQNGLYAKLYEMQFREVDLLV